jgi:glycosyltransferase involved in cell wall biosynthesis
MKKIVVITSSHPPLDTRIFKKECLSLQNAGYSISIIAPWPGKTNTKGIKFIPIPLLPSRLDRLLNLFKIAKLAVRQKADIYHIHEPELLILYYYIKINLPRMKYIYDVHENYSGAILSGEKHYIPSYIKSFLAKTVNLIEKVLSQKCDLVIAAAPDIASKFRRNTHVVRNLPYKPKLSYQSFSVLGNCKERTILYSGSITRSRAIKEILLAVGIVNRDFPTRFILIGNFHDVSFKEELWGMLEAKYMNYHGYEKNQEKLFKMISTALITPVLFYPEPNLDTAVQRSNKLYEYMSLGKPVIVSDIPAWAEFVKHYECGVTANPYDPESIANAIKFFSLNPEKADRMGRNGRLLVENEFNWEKEKDNLLTAYASLYQK